MFEWGSQPASAHASPPVRAKGVHQGTHPALTPARATRHAMFGYLGVPLAWRRQRREHLAADVIAQTPVASARARPPPSRLAQEVVNYICDWCPSGALGRLSFITHSLGARRPCSSSSWVRLRGGSFGP